MKMFLSLFVGMMLSSVSFADEARVFVGLSPAGSFIGKTSDITGTVKKEGDLFKAENVVVSLKNLKTGIQVRDEHTAKHLEVSKFPDAVLIVGKAKDGKGVAKVKIHGIEKEVRGTYEMSGKLMKAQFPIKFSDFGISGINYMGIGVKDEGKIEVDITVQ